MVNKTLVKITKLIVDILFVLGFFVIAFLYHALKWYGDKIDPGLHSNFVPIVCIIAFCGVFALLILWELKKMLKTVINENCFVHDNVKSLNRMAVYSIVISASMAVRCLIFPTLAALAMVLTFFIAALFSKVLSIVFAAAVSYKEENDYTI